MDGNHGMRRWTELTAARGVRGRGMVVHVRGRRTGTQRSGILQTLRTRQRVRPAGEKRALVRERVVDGRREAGGQAVRRTRPDWTVPAGEGRLVGVALGVAPGVVLEDDLCRVWDG